ncbi:helix-turn-helix domain-containing protein [Lactobacillus pentosus]|uniref:helix-turn-helix domain-containing protein n=1 Tax=Lactiplantibacillus TaxID=2767842 RepID=UPI000268102F|nr:MULTISPECIES: helix-turn-helix transcriptional regulator [Lactiplantibacillus]BBM20844.1 XRE family transcriptional regulator [Lactiplantibacillus plantarum]EIW14618.1 transcription regulator, Xre family [Lactiplantibacillus pentosus KCA1]MBU7449665.1 helix-turn-helix transcriptional regulator [Lactiplantibacillus sp. 7.2.4]MBU7481198.1 helix-turn-helix transcriptional regulator [Lactiplantibacillus pentosus]MBU7504029.1 helix-turn-helix transcriptional regulator [Lactiplantibacillus pentos
MTMEYFGDKLKSLRKAKKLTQAELAQQLDISKWAITSYEQGKTYPSIEVLIKICAVLDTSSDYLLGISDKLPVKMSTLGFTDEEVRLLLQFLNLFQQNRTPMDK